MDLRFEKQSIQNQQSAIKNLKLSHPRSFAGLRHGFQTMKWFGETEKANKVEKLTQQPKT
ncbi:hypothetical protein NIES592_23955 [Fischerella major NIES-592]|uniref:Uncharacterized protein n=1 Tax=Fischerella major NIES-592 TaxID=210994 RepID=A0A1U7GSL7_9CYAN|nr:hypothetical protein NIES592_23955 [Fischerella major NIES-592]